MIKAALFSLMLAMQGTQPLDDPKEEARAQDLMREIRCVACENEPVSQSGSDIARDMRARIRTLVAEGKTDEEIRDWFVARYGEFVLFRPDSEGVTGKLLWGLPFALLLVGGGLLFMRSQAGRQAAVDPIDPEEA
ncbi:cytochrome c-type biogenesis protein [Hyphomonas sp. FCG-A18]|jgi:cytochrome c-type biogenesis protein CcmH|uniref:cytochrome c-type biogenesis protein n=1 Tax=Hyphomonas sp. FCG-A18 TaxID=3080019 RepID=UPI002B2ECEE3|nr:cytochrome c-type biogenesis protein [Hyphomonas sp. FCG-A18]